MPISKKQRQIMAFPFTKYDALVADGALRSGKTVFMMLSFVDDAMRRYNNQRFGICGKTVDSTVKNLIMPYIGLTYAKDKYRIQWKRTDKILVVSDGQHENTFEVFGGKDESSFSLIQGRTLAGVLLDEVALQPRSFVEQACARCSVTGSRLWFNCNPAGPGHWFYRNWILEAEQRNCLRLHFTMEDNPSLTEEIRQRYQRLYTGVFYRRYILGQWAQAEGRVYDFFEPEMVKKVPEGPFDKWYVSCDYGTVNPTSMGLWGLHQGVWYRVQEFYFASRERQHQMTDEEYAEALANLVGKRFVTAVIVDPSAASFIEVLKRKGWRVKKADNDVLGGIRLTSDCLKDGRMVICEGCSDCLREMDEYVWDLSDGARDRVKKEHDHAMDEMRYFAATVLGKKSGGFAVATVERRK